jgi:hypothetical protein
MVVAWSLANSFPLLAELAVVCDCESAAEAAILLGAVPSAPESFESLDVALADFHDRDNDNETLLAMLGNIANAAALSKSLKALRVERIAKDTEFGDGVDVFPVECDCSVLLDGAQLSRSLESLTFGMLCFEETVPTSDAVPNLSVRKIEFNTCRHVKEKGVSRASEHSSL